LPRNPQPLDVTRPTLQAFAPKKKNERSHNPDRVAAAREQRVGRQGRHRLIDLEARTGLLFPIPIIETDRREARTRARDRFQ
jgi:hypothetical protein